jgi:hypothetical protein
VNHRVVPDYTPSNGDVLADFAVGADHALIYEAILPYFRVDSNDGRGRNAASEVPFDICSHIFVESLLLVDHLVEFWGGVENHEVHHERIALARDHILSDHLVGPRISDLGQVVSGGEDVSLNLIVRDLARVQLYDEVFFQVFHPVVFLQVGEDGARADCDFTVNKVAS